MQLALSVRIKKNARAENPNDQSVAGEWGEHEENVNGAQDIIDDRFGCFVRQPVSGNVVQVVRRVDFPAERL